MNIFGANLAVKPKRRREIYDNVAELSQPGASYHTMVALATIIASLGLMIGSPAVVIGAMLVQPLMGPIFGICLGLTTGSRRLLWGALKYEVFGVILAVGVAAAVGLLAFDIPIDDEWLMRTRPTLYDLIIALASGFAGAYALIDERMSPALPGVAIAVAVLPPLAACGLSIAILRWDMALGAFMLFTANFLAIQIAAAIVFSLFGLLRGGRNKYDDEEKAGIRHFVKRFGVSFVALAIIAWFMTTTLAGIMGEQRLRSTIDDTLSEEVRTSAGARLSDFDFEREDDLLRVTAQVMTPRALEPDDVAEIEEALEASLEFDVHLIVRAMISRDVDREGTVFANEEELRSEAEAGQRAEFMRATSRVISEHLEPITGAELTDIRRSRPNGRIGIIAVISAPEAVTPEQVRAMQEALREELDLDVDLVARTVFTRHTTATGYINDTAMRMRPEQATVITTARATLESWLAQNADGARLSELELDATTEPWKLTAQLLSPGPVSTAQAADMQRELLRELPREVGLTVRYSLGGELAAAEAAVEGP